MRVTRSRIGVTLAELVVALVLFGAIAALVWGAVTSSQRLAQAQAERAVLAATLRAGALVLPAELQELSSGPGSATDVVALGPGDITYRGMRGFGVTCDVAAGSIRVRDDLLFGVRRPQAGRDTLLLFAEGDPATGADDQWIVLPLLSVGTGSCGSVPATILGTTLSAATAASVVVGSPVRLFETMQVRQYLSGGDYWLGARSVSAGEVIQPVLGPLEPNGFILVGRDSAGSGTTDPARLRRLDITVRGRTQRGVVGGAGQSAARSGVIDSLSFTISLRNAGLP